MIHTATICMGSNCSPRRRNLDDALQRIASECRIVSVSDVHESADISGAGAHYLNCVAVVETTLSRTEFESMLERFERLGGRRPDSKQRGSMPIDIDLVLWDDTVVSQHDYEAPYFKALCSRS